LFGKDEMGIIEKKIKEWTTDFAEREKHIIIFDRIRDIPFAVETDLFLRDGAPTLVLKRNKGFCVPKHHLLGLMFRELKVPVRYHTYSFRWNELNVEMPRELKKLAKELPLTYHLACGVLIRENWFFLDATWDSALKNAAFPINENWDGNSDTKNAVIPLEEFVTETIHAQKKLYRDKIEAYTFSEKLKLEKFSKKLNKWLDEIR